jgi:hypothetical protein
MSFSASPRGNSPGTPDNDRRAARRSRSTYLVVVRVNPERDGPVYSGKLQDVSAGGIGVLIDRVVPYGAMFLIKPFRDTGATSATLLYRAVRCEPHGRRFLLGGVLISVAGDIERDTKGQIVPAELERIRRALTAA